MGDTESTLKCGNVTVAVSFRHIWNFIVQSVPYSKPRVAWAVESPLTCCQRAVDKMLPSGTEVVARYNFNGKSSEDLSFTKGDIMTIVSDTPDCNWFRARHSDGREGLIPLNYILRRAEVKLNSMP
ncbi:hypothetical protein V5799_005927 [Amblyomma americanum]|uniref:SH3 domain-containing protein n=1 Tax=Amblyomma americanum TaxID=6943 RepID=A0AAQ4DXV3_AMBAM